MTRYRRIAAAALAILALALHPIVVESNDPGAAAVVDARRAGGDDASAGDGGNSPRVSFFGVPREPDDGVHRLFARAFRRIRAAREVDARDLIISWSQPTTHATSSIEPASRTLPRRLLEPQLRRRSLRQAQAEGCPDLASGDLKFSVTTWSSLPSEDLVRVGAVDAAITGGAAAAREMYVSLVVTHKKADASVNLRGVTVAFEFSRTVVVDESTGETEVADPSRFVFMCWGAQLLPTAADGSDGGHRSVPCSELILDIDAVGPRVTFGDVTLGPGEFLAGGYSNFLFSFKEMGAMPMENSVALLAPFCDDAAVDRPAAELPLLAPTFMLGWNPNKHLELSACPALLDMVFHSLVLEVDVSDTSTTIASGVVGHRSCASMDVTGVTVPVPYARTVDPASFETGCSGIQLALPAPTFRSDGMSAMQGMEQPALTCDDVVVTMTSDGLRISFVDGALKLCPGCFLVGGPDNVMASWRTLDGSDASLIPIGPPAMPYCGAGPDMSLTAEVGPVTPCNAEENAELDGEVLNGGTFLTSSAGACCLACQENPGCNVWTFCTDEGGCGGAAPTYSYSRCSLKYQDPAQLSPEPAPGKRGPEITFTSGSLPEKETEIFVADTVQQIRNETGETCAVCQIEDAANYKGDPLIDGTNLLVDSSEACCAKCAEDDRCNSFVYCGSESGCGGEYYDYKHRECWLKFLAEDMWTQFPVPAWNRGEGVPWTSGIVNRTRCVERVLPPPSPPAIVTIPLPQPPPPSPEQPPPVRTAPTTCAEGASSIAELCTGVLLGQEESLEVDDASECCGVITWMNADERRCFCDTGIVASLGRLADPLLLVGGIVCEVEILSGDACAPAPTPTPAPVPEPSAPEPPPPDAPTQPTPAPGPPLPGAPAQHEPGSRPRQGHQPGPLARQAPQGGSHATRGAPARQELHQARGHPLGSLQPRGHRPAHGAPAREA